jgi:hypothetical protein
MGVRRTLCVALQGSLTAEMWASNQQLLEDYLRERNLLAFGMPGASSLSSKVLVVCSTGAPRLPS